MTAVHRTGWVTHKSSISACLWRIVISPAIPQDSPPCYDSLMRNLAVLFIHFIATLARLLGPVGVRSLVAESLLLKHQLLIVNRSRQRSPNLSASDRILAGLLALLVRPARLLRSAIVLKPSTKDQITRSTWARCQGECGADRTSQMSISGTCSRKSWPKIASRSRSR